MGPGKPEAIQAAEELEILSPDRAISIGGESLVIRELSYLQAIRFGTRARPLIESLACAIIGNEIDDKAFLEAVEDHAEIFLEMICLCTGRKAEDFDGISEEEGEKITAGSLHNSIKKGCPQGQPFLFYSFKQLRR